MLINKKILFLLKLNLKLYMKYYLDYSNKIKLELYPINSKMFHLNYKYNCQMILNVKAKFLFLLTIYLLLTYINTFKLYSNYICRVLPNRKKIITILRAPCNHKNSKEQYIKFKYKANIILFNQTIQTYIYKKYMMLYIEKYMKFYIKFLDYIFNN